MTDKPNKYNHSKLYKLQCDDEYYYIGCTTDSLPKRLGGHKTKSKRYPEQRVYSHINKIGWDHMRIVLVSEHNLENKEQLLREEDKLIKECKDDPLCLNTYRSLLNDEERKKHNNEHAKEYREINKDILREKRKEHYENNKDKIKEIDKKYRENNREIVAQKRKEYYDDNKEEILEKRKIYYENNKDVTLKRMAKEVMCICGSLITHGSKKRHEKSIKHITYIKDKNNKDIEC